MYVYIMCVYTCVCVYTHRHTDTERDTHSTSINHLLLSIHSWSFPEPIMMTLFVSRFRYGLFSSGGLKSNPTLETENSWRPAWVVPACLLLQLPPTHESPNVVLATSKIGPYYRYEIKALLQVKILVRNTLQKEFPWILNIFQGLSLNVLTYFKKIFSNECIKSLYIAI